ncbi:MAG: replicative DNA helicase [Deltaproteobacteria bacterium]|nr:replicative DNA helicase [Deltaproteobacteria bacterium]
MTQTLSERIPPQDLDAERAVLGGMLIDPDAIHRVVELLEAEAFYREGHREIFQTILSLYERNEPADLITVTSALRNQQRLESLGGAAYLASLADQVPTTANIAYYARIVRQLGILRRLIQGANDIARLAYEGDQAAVDDLVDQAERVIFDIAQRKITRSFFSLREVVKETFKTIEQLYEQKATVTGVPTGFSDLDRMTSGLQRSDLVIVAGRPSMGKTSLATCMMVNAALAEGKPAAFFSLEMSKEQVVQRLLCSTARVDASKLRGGFLSESDWPKLTRAAGQLSETAIYIDDTPALSVLEMRAKSRRLQREKGLGIVLVDYLQLMRVSGRVESREREISEISRSLKALAKELNVPVVALSQLNRAVENRQDKRPQLADLRESGAIEQDADVIVFVYRDEMYNRESPDKGIAEIIIGKQRNGPTGLVKLAFINEYTRFEDLAH